MRKKLVLTLVTITFSAGLLSLWHMTRRNTRSLYVNLSDSLVRGLDAQDVEDLLQGNGMGYARMT